MHKNFCIFVFFAKKYLVPLSYSKSWQNPFITTLFEDSFGSVDVYEAFSFA
jgi:hypothetical protein